MDMSLTVDSDSELGFAVSKAKEWAIGNNDCVYVYTDGYVFHMTNQYPSEKKVVARCYPGGRVEILRVCDDYSNSAR